MIAKGGTVGPFGKAIERSVQRIGLLCLPLALPDAVIDVRLKGLPDLDESGVALWRIDEGPSINAKSCFGLGGQDFVDSWTRQRVIPWAESYLR
ncbi:hypothetical protein NJ75_04644 [Novosphingobium subterraneum]|uniref:Uncharacterized protein n=1 Tax=Novosphingobium subterraneum TaxID=48936 RepID=A0A0B8ZF02_9SPHN|nr:hypothetical protein NJ75_04644 [Novosphingobium subterraneum]